MVLRTLTHRRISEKLLFLIMLVAVTYVPQLHITPEVRSQVFGLLFSAALAWLRSWTIQLSTKAIPREEQRRKEDQ